MATPAICLSISSTRATAKRAGLDTFLGEANMFFIGASSIVCAPCADAQRALPHVFRSLQSCRGDHWSSASYSCVSYSIGCVPVNICNHARRELPQSAYGIQLPPGGSLIVYVSFINQQLLSLKAALFQASLREGGGPAAGWWKEPAGAQDAYSIKRGSYSILCPPTLPLIHYY